MKFKKDPDMSNIKILWADDEIDLLKPHILFLRGKGYDVETANNGRDAIEMAHAVPYSLIILDENMPGLTGLETLSEIKQISPSTPVIMITKSEEENIMDQAVGNKIADYLIKPVNPNQILLSIKKNIHAGSLVERQTSDDYRRDFISLASDISTADSCGDWANLYRRLVGWELKLAHTNTGMEELLQGQMTEANSEFFKFVRRNYESWLNPDNPERPLLSPDIFRKVLFPMLGEQPVFFILIDNFRLDQWETIKPILADSFTTDEQLYFSILPTATQYSRNAIFSGLMPEKIATMFPELWVDEDEQEGKNLNESPLVETQFQRFRRQCKFSYNKINDSASGEKLLKDFNNLLTNDLNIIVLNFIDMMSHAKTESKMMRELASTDAAYRSITESWFRHSSAIELFRRIARTGCKIVLTTDHGTISVQNSVKVIGDKNTNTNLRYKVGKNLNYPSRMVYEIKKPEAYGLPSPNISSTYIFAGNRDFFAYPNNYNYYVQYYTGTFQHGGISMQEMIVPLITLTPKK